MAAGTGELEHGIAVPIQPQPLHPVQDRGDGRLGRTRAIGVLDPQQRFAAVAPAWSYGGAASLFYLAQGMTAALLQLPITAAASRPSLR